MTGNNPQATDKFYYGFRQVVQQDVTGQPSYTRYPLEPADFLDPQPDDQFVQGAHHQRDVDELVRILRYHYRNNQYITVESGWKMEWRDPQLAAPMADVVVLAAPAGVESVTETGPRMPRCVIEVTSPRLAQVDLEQKPSIYAQGGVTEYLIIDDGQREHRDGEALSNEAYRIWGFRLQDGRYQPIEPDENGRIFSETNQVWIGPTPQRDGFVVLDARTEQPVHPAESIVEDRTAQSRGEHRASELSAALDFLRKGGSHA